MSSSGARRRPQKYPDELREPAVRMVSEIRRETGERHGAVTRVAKELEERSRLGPGTRLHFWDDNGRTGKVYVGYLGRHLPNFQTN